MNLLRIILHAALVPTLFVVAQAASAAVNTAPGAAQSSSERAAVSDKKQRQRDRSAPPAAAGVRRNAPASPHPDDSKDTGKAQQGKGQTARTNSDRVRSLLNRPAPRSRTAVAANRRSAPPTAAASRHATAPTAAAGGAPRISGDRGPSAANLSRGRANLSQGPASAVRNGVAPRAAVALPQNSAARTGTLGGPRAQEHVRPGGPSLGKPAHAAALDGTQLRRRKY
jgi:hypothetical protein